MSDILSSGTKGWTGYEEVTPALRWVPKSFVGFELKLQQAWKVYEIDGNGYAEVSRLEWRDVPTEHNPS